MASWMIYDQSEWFICYSPRIKENLEELGYFYEGYPEKSTYVHIVTRKHAWVYKRDELLNSYLAKCYDNKVNNLGLTNKEIVDIFRQDT